MEENIRSHNGCKENFWKSITMDARVKITMDTKGNNTMDAMEGFALSIRFCGNSKP
jgi:hypothetical protein